MDQEPPSCSRRENIAFLTTVLTLLHVDGCNHLLALSLVLCDNEVWWAIWACRPLVPYDAFFKEQADAGNLKAGG